MNSQTPAQSHAAVDTGVDVRASEGFSVGGLLENSRAALQTGVEALMETCCCNSIECSHDIAACAIATVAGKRVHGEASSYASSLGTCQDAHVL